MNHTEDKNHPPPNFLGRNHNHPIGVAWYYDAPHLHWIVEAMEVVKEEKLKENNKSFPSREFGCGKMMEYCYMISLYIYIHRHERSLA